MKVKVSILILGIILLLGQGNSCDAVPVGSAFTHQGQLREVNIPANGTFDFEFKLYDDPNDGSQLGSDQLVSGVNVTNGLFTTLLDFGESVFNGEASWVELAVKGFGEPNWTTLAPRQELTPAPYAIYAKKAGQVAGGIGIKGSGTANYIPKFIDTNTIGDSTINEFSTDGTLADNSDSAVPTEKAVKSYVDNKFSAPSAGVVPVGGVVAWLKSFPNTPAFPDNFVECNGQILNDSNSPYNGQTIPNLNGASGGAKRFLRGSTTSGETGGSDTNSHTHTVSRGGIECGHAEGGQYPATSGQVTSGTASNTNNMPAYYEVVWIMRVK